MFKAIQIALVSLSIILVGALGLYAQQKMHTNSLPSMPIAPAPIEPEQEVTLPTAPIMTAPALSPEATKDLIASLSTSTSSTSTGKPPAHIALPALPTTKEEMHEEHAEEHIASIPEIKEEHPHDMQVHHEILSKLATIDSRLISIKSTLQDLAQELVTITKP